MKINDNGTTGSVFKPLSDVERLINAAPVGDLVMLMVLLGNQEITPSVEIPAPDPLVVGKE